MPAAEPPGIVILGAGGHGRSVIDVLATAASFRAVALIDRDPARQGTEMLGVPVAGDESRLPSIRAAGVVHAALGIGGARDNGPRRAAYDRLLAAGFALPSIVHGSAIVAKSAAVGAGSQIHAGAIVNALARIGANVIVNTGAIVEHDCVISDHVHVAPRAVLGGGCTVGEGAHVGIGATVIQGIRIGSGAVVGAGAVVIRDVVAGATVVGVPARERPRA